MKKKPTTTTKQPTTALLTSPLISFTTPILTRSSPKPPFFDFDLKSFTNNNTSSSRKNKSSTVMTSKTSVLIKSNTVTTSPSSKPAMTISDLKELVSVRSDSLKRNLDVSHSEILKEFEAADSRLSKRYKIHSQTCQQVMDEADKEFKKLSKLISENVEAMKTSYAESISKAEASAARVCKTSIAELSQSMEKAIEGLRSRYGVQLKAT